MEAFLGLLLVSVVIFESEAFHLKDGMPTNSSENVVEFVLKEAGIKFDGIHPASVHIVTGNNTNRESIFTKDPNLTCDMKWSVEENGKTHLVKLSCEMMYSGRRQVEVEIDPVHYGQAYFPHPMGGVQYPPVVGGMAYPPPVVGGVGYPPPVVGGVGYPPPVVGGVGYPPPVVSGVGYPPPVVGGVGYPPPVVGGVGYPPPVVGGDPYGPGGYYNVIPGAVYGPPGVITYLPAGYACPPQYQCLGGPGVSADQRNPKIPEETTPGYIFDKPTERRKEKKVDYPWNRNSSSEEEPSTERYWGVITKKWIIPGPSFNSKGKIRKTKSYSFDEDDDNLR